MFINRWFADTCYPQQLDLIVRSVIVFCSDSDHKNVWLVIN